MFGVWLWHMGSEIYPARRLFGRRRGDDMGVVGDHASKGEMQLFAVKSSSMSMAALPSGCPVIRNFGEEANFSDSSLTKMSSCIPANGTALIKSPHSVGELFLSWPVVTIPSR